MKNLIGREHSINSQKLVNAISAADIAFIMLFNICLVTKPLGVFSSETKWLNASLLFLRMNYVKNV